MVKSRPTIQCKSVSMVDLEVKIALSKQSKLAKSHAELILSQTQNRKMLQKLQLLYSRKLQKKLLVSNQIVCSHTLPHYQKSRPWKLSSMQQLVSINLPLVVLVSLELHQMSNLKFQVLHRKLYLSAQPKPLLESQVSQVVSKPKLCGCTSQKVSLKSTLLFRQESIWNQS